MSWGKWFSDPTGPGKVSQKVERHSDGSKTSHTMRTADHAKTGSKSDHSHVVVRQQSNGRTSAHGHGIRGGKRN